MSTLLRHVYCFHSQGKLENEFLWVKAERAREGHKRGWRACVCVCVSVSVPAGHGVRVVNGERVGSPNCAVSLTGDFKLRQLNCGKTGSVVPFARICHSFTPRGAEGGCKHTTCVASSLLEKLS